MEIHRYDAEAIWYAPDFQDNREKPEDERFAVLIVPMSRHEYQRLEERHSKLSRGGKLNFTRRYNKLRNDVVMKCVREVKHLTLVNHKSDGSRGDLVSIDDGRGLIEHAPEEILEDILTAVRDQSEITEGMLKKSVSPSATSS